MFPRAPGRRRGLLLGLTFVVAFCSIVYELIYSEMLRVLFGGTVLRYSITIGLFLFSLGVGAFCYRYVGDVEQNFFRTEVALSVVGPFGLLLMVGVNSAPAIQFPLKSQLVLVVSHLPIVVVGVLSGLEIPFLSELIDSEGESFSEVLGVDYFGSLVGTVVYALVLYPTLGLVTAIFVLGLANAVVALLFAYDGAFESSSTPVLVACLLVTASYAGVVAAGDRAERAVEETYIGAGIESEYPPGTASVTIREIERTAHQRVVIYDRTLDATPNRPRQTERCLRMDGQLQLCESWVASYHQGLVDVPMTTVPDGPDTRVLLVGGGDHIATNRLRDHDVTVDQVDLDGEFLDYTKSHPYFEQYHDDAYRYDRLTTYETDALTYLRNTDRQYDLVLLDLPGARNDGLLPVYSTEFYRLVRAHLTDDGVVVSWGYDRNAYATHYKAYMNTVGTAGFDRQIAYNAWEDMDDDGAVERGERFYVLAPDPRRAPAFGTASNLTATGQRRYGDARWRAIPRYDGVEPNSIFDPNYDIIIN